MRHFSELSPSALRVVDAAEDLLQHRGYNGFSYDDVAALVGIKKPSIHHHFPRKEDLVASVTQRYSFRLRAKLLEIEGRTGDPYERLVAYGGLFEEIFASGGKLCLGGMLGAQSESLPESVKAEVKEFFRINVRWLRAMVTEGQEAGIFRTDSPAECLAEVLLCALEGSMVVGRTLRCARGPAEVGRTVLAGFRLPAAEGKRSARVARELEPESP